MAENLPSGRKSCLKHATYDCTSCIQSKIPFKYKGEHMQDAG